MAVVSNNIDLKVQEAVNDIKNQLRAMELEMGAN